MEDGLAVLAPPADTDGLFGPLVKTVLYVEDAGEAVDAAGYTKQIAGVALEAATAAWPRVGEGFDMLD